MTRC
ncbi:hypothetical protein MC885_004991 [Smutsia gigantea]